MPSSISLCWKRANTINRKTVLQHLTGGAQEYHKTLQSVQLVVSLNQRFPDCEFQPLYFRKFCLLILRTQQLLRRPWNEASCTHVLHIIPFCFRMQVHPLSSDLTSKKQKQSLPTHLSHNCSPVTDINFKSQETFSFKNICVFSTFFRHHAEVSNLEMFTEPKISKMSQAVAAGCKDLQQNT